MTAHTWTPDEDARIVPYVATRIDPARIAWLAEWLHRSRAQVRRRRRALRRRGRRGGR